MPNAQPLPENPEEAKTPPVDLLDYLRESWLASNPNVDDLSEGQIELLLGDFIKHARQMLRDNLPVGMDYLSDVPSLRFQDATTLPIVKVENVSQMAESTGSFPIAKQPKVAPGNKGTTASRSWDVTTGK